MLALASFPVPQVAVCAGQRAGQGLLVSGIEDSPSSYLMLTWSLPALCLVREFNISVCLMSFFLGLLGGDLPLTQIGGLKDAPASWTEKKGRPEQKGPGRGCPQ